MKCFSILNPRIRTILSNDTLHASQTKVIAYKKATNLLLSIRLVKEKVTNSSIFMQSCFLITCNHLVQDMKAQRQEQIPSKCSHISSGSRKGDGILLCFLSNPGIFPVKPSAFGRVVYTNPRYLTRAQNGKQTSVTEKARNLILTSGSAYRITRTCNQ